MEGLLHLFAFFFDDMIDFEKVNQGSHVRFLCCDILWTVFEEEAYFMSESELKGGTAIRREACASRGVIGHFEVSETPSIFWVFVQAGLSVKRLYESCV